MKSSKQLSLNALEKFYWIGLSSLQSAYVIKCLKFFIYKNTLYSQIAWILPFKSRVLLHRNTVMMKKRKIIKCIIIYLACINQITFKLSNSHVGYILPDIKESQFCFVCRQLMIFRYLPFGMYKKLENVSKTWSHFQILEVHIVLGWQENKTCATWQNFLFDGPRARLPLCEGEDDCWTVVVAANKSILVLYYCHQTSHEVQADAFFMHHDNYPLL